MENNKVLLLYVLVVLGVNFSSTDALETTTADYAAGTTDYTSSDTTGEYTTATTTDPPTVVFTTTDPHTTAASADATSIPATDNTTATVMDTTTTTAMNYTTSTTTTPLITNSTIDVSTTSPATITTTSATTTSTTNSTNTPSTTANTTDPCYSDPCGDNGTCTTLSEYPYYKCDCQPPYIGDNCTQDACYQQPCEENGGQCEVISDEPFYTCPCYLPQLGTYFCAKERIFLVAIPVGGLLLLLVIMIILIACLVRKRRIRKSARNIEDEEAGAIPLSSMEQTNPSIATNNSDNSATNEKSENHEEEVDGHEEGVEDVEANAVILLVEEAINTGNEEVSIEPIPTNNSEVLPTTSVTSKETDLPNMNTPKATPEQDVKEDDGNENLLKQNKNSIEPAPTTASKESEVLKKNLPDEETSERDVEHVVKEEKESLQSDPETSKELGDADTTHEAVQTEAIKSEVSPGKDVEVEENEKMDASIATLKADGNIVATDVEVSHTSNKDGEIGEEEMGPLQQDNQQMKIYDNNTTTSKQQLSHPSAILKQEALQEADEDEKEVKEENEVEKENEEKGNFKAKVVVIKEDGIIDNTNLIKSTNSANTGETNSSLLSEPLKVSAPTAATDSREKVILEVNDEKKNFLEANTSLMNQGENTTTTTTTKFNQETFPPKEVTDEDVEAIATTLEADEKIAVEDIRRLPRSPVNSTDEEQTSTTSTSQRTEIVVPTDKTVIQVAKFDEEANEMQNSERENNPIDVSKNTSSTTTTKPNQTTRGEDNEKVETVSVTESKDIYPTSPTEPTDEVNKTLDAKENRKTYDPQVNRSRLSSVLRNEVKSAATKLNPITEATKPDITDEEKRNMQQDADGNWHYQTVRNFWEATTSETLGTNNTTKTSGDQTIKESQTAGDENDRANQDSQG